MRILITGVTGSFGTEFSRQFSGAYDIHGLSRSEVLQVAFPYKEKVILHKGSVVDEARVTEVIRLISPDWVIHAAAYKHISTGCGDSVEMMDVNINGTRSVLRACSRCGIGSRVLLVSTDKAVEATTFYGKTKACAEGIVIEVGGIVIRYGNVLGSSGSIVPLFLDSASKGQYLGIREHPVYGVPTRFFIRLSDAIQMVHSLLGCPSGIYVPRELKAARIDEVARQCVQFVGKGAVIPSGSLLYGEKLHEILLDHMEGYKAQKFGNFWRVARDSHTLGQRRVEVSSDKPEGGMYTPVELAGLIRETSDYMKGLA